MTYEEIIAVSSRDSKNREVQNIYKRPWVMLERPWSWFTSSKFVSAFSGTNSEARFYYYLAWSNLRSATAVSFHSPSSLASEWNNSLFLQFLSFAKPCRKLRPNFIFFINYRSTTFTLHEYGNRSHYRFESTDLNPFFSESGQYCFSLPIDKKIIRAKVFVWYELSLWHTQSKSK